jgi:adenylate cyclase
MVAAGVVIGIGAIAVAVTQAAFLWWRWWVPVVPPLVALAVAYGASTVASVIREQRQRRRLSRFFSPAVVSEIMRNDEDRLASRRRRVTVLFSDIRGFTAMTEKGNAEALVAQLNEYFSTMVEVVFRHHGTVDKFVGDMVMALFSAPVEDADHAEHAVSAAIEMVSELGKLNRKWLAEGKVQLDIGIGINSGEMIAGNIGSERIMSYTVIGDNVNLGSRLESLNKEFQSRIIISDATRTRLRTERTLRPLGEVTVKGKTQAVSIFEVVVPSPVAEPSHAPEESRS